MTEISERFRRRAAAFTARVDAVSPDQWESQSPCDDWVARDVVRHMVSNAQRFLGFVDQELPLGPSVDDDPAGAWANARDALQAGLDDPAVATREFDGMAGKQTFEQAVDRFGGPDLVVHSWDLARAAGLDDHLDPDDVHQILEAMGPMDDMMRGSGAFGPKLEPPPGADEQTRLLAFWDAPSNTGIVGASRRPGGPMTATELRYIDSDGHILEHPTGMPDYAPAEYRDRIWHIETDEAGEEWLHYDGTVIPANFMAAAGTAGLSDEDRARSFRGELRYTEVRPAAYNAKARLQDMDQDGIDLAVLYPTMLLGLQSFKDVDFAEAQARAYNDWCSDHTQEGEGRLFGAGAVPPMHEPDDVARVAAEIRRVAELPGMVSVFMRPNPSVDWRPFNDPVYDPIWQAAQDTGLPIALHPFLSPDLPGACVGLRLARPRKEDGSYVDNFNPDTMQLEEQTRDVDLSARSSVLFTQAIANPVDVMSCIAYLTAGGVCERFPEAKFIFLEANGGWIVPWLERLDHHCKKFQWEVTDLSMLPSDYMKRQCWISFDPDEAMLAMTAQSPLVGAERIIWASDYPHPDAKFPGVTEELTEALEGLTFEQKQAITSESALALYGLT